MRCLPSVVLLSRSKTPTTYSDRLVLQMLVGNDRLTRALLFKQSVEEQGRNLDLASYGSLIQYYSRRDQLGTALLFLKECLQQHDAPPSEAYLTNVRLLCKRNSVTGLNSMIGDDPIEWLKYGEAHLKREVSKRGRRNINFAKNRLLA